MNENTRLARRLMRRLIAAVFGLVAATGCATGSVEERFGCTEDELSRWQIPAGWIERELSPAEARAEVISSNIVQDSAEARWGALKKQWREGDRYWLYRRPGTDTINDLGVQEGVVLIRGCEQLGFVTTRMATEAERSTEP